MEFNMVSSEPVVLKDMVTSNPDLIRRFMAATTQSVEAAEKAPAEATAAVLAALPGRACRVDTLQEGSERTIPPARTAETKAERLFRTVTDAQHGRDGEVALVDYGASLLTRPSDPRPSTPTNSC